MSFKRPPPHLSPDQKSLHLVFLQPGLDYAGDKDAMNLAPQVHDKGVAVSNTKEMVLRAMSMGIGYDRKIGRLTIVSHGNWDAFHIGKDRISEPYLKPNYPDPEKRKIYGDLLTLKPWFDREAMVFIQACHCGQPQKDGKSNSLLRAMSQLWAVPVVGFTGDVYFGQGVEYEGKMTVCISQMEQCLHL